MSSPLDPKATRLTPKLTNTTTCRPNRAGGIIVDYNIVLANSIGWAAQQFGYALANSLGMTNYRLANQQQFVIELNSIKFNGKYLFLGFILFHLP